MSDTTPPPGPPSVYFIRGGARIKIGWSKDPKKRLSHLVTGSSEALELLAATGGGADDEQHVHQAFRHAHVRREWFRASPWLLALVDWVKGGGGLVRTAYLLGCAEERLEAGDRARVAAEARAAGAEAELAATRFKAASELSQAKREIEALGQRWARNVSDVVLYRMAAMREEFYRAKDQTDDHDGLASAMEAEVLSCAADVIHAIDRCSCGHSFNDDGTAYYDPAAHCGATGPQPL